MHFFIALCFRKWYIIREGRRDMLKLITTAKVDKMETVKTIIVAEDSCGDELENFVAWMEEAHPEVEVVVENTLHGDSQEYWDEYCNA